jgi:hypothetical protein
VSTRKASECLKPLRRSSASEVDQHVAPTLRHATDLLGEQLATMTECHDGFEQRIAEVNRLLWELRWRLGILPGGAS